MPVSVLVSERQKAVGRSAAVAVRGSDMRKQLADHEVADAHTMCRGGTANVAGEAFGLRCTDSDGLK